MKGSAGFIAVSLLLGLALFSHVAHAATPVMYKGYPVGVCYPYVVTRTGVLDLVLGKYVSVFTSPAVRVYCGDPIVVVARDALYMVGRDGRVEHVVAVPGDSVLGAVKGTAFVLDGDKVVVVGVGGSAVIDVPRGARSLSYGVVDGLPAVAYLSPGGGGVDYVYVAVPGHAYRVATVHGATAAALTRDGYLVVDAGGVLHAYRLRLAGGGLVAEEDSSLATYVPLAASRIAGSTGGLLVETSSGDAAWVNMWTHKWVYIGRGEPTPAGVYRGGYTAVPYGGAVAAVPGRAVGLLGDVAVTGLRAGNETYTALWPLNKSVLFLKTAVSGTLLHRGYAFRVDLPPGVYYVPMGSVIVTEEGTIPVERVAVEYPEATGPAVNRTLTPTFVAVPFPKHTFYKAYRGVRYVDSGGGYLLAVLGDRAVVYSTMGTVSEIPGAWVFGGVGDKYVALYDGAMLHLFTLAGDPVAAYAVQLPPSPLHVQVWGNGTVAVYYRGREVVVDGRGVRVLRAGAVSYGEMRVRPGPPAVIIYGGYTYAVNASFAHANKGYAAWSAGDAWYLLSVPDNKVYVVVNATPADVYPLPGAVAALVNGTLRIYPVVSWVTCYAYVAAPPNATVYINGTVFNGTVKYYAPCGATLNISVTMPYHKPFTALVHVKPGGTVVNATLPPLVSNVSVYFSLPRGLRVDSATLRIDGRTVTVRNGETIELVAGKPYRIQVVGFHPYDVCEHVTITKRFRVGSDELIIPCKVAGAVLGLESNASVVVRVTSQATKTSINVTVPAGKVVFVSLQPGAYSLHVTPLTRGYAPRELNVTLRSGTVTVVDVTPRRVGKLVVTAVPPTAVLQVYASNGTLVAKGVGKVSATLRPGVYRVSAIAPGYKPKILLVTVKAGEIVTKTVTLEPSITKKPKPSLMEQPAVRASLIAVVAAAVIASIWLRKRRASVVEGEEQ